MRMSLRSMSVASVKSIVPCDFWISKSRGMEAPVIIPGIRRRSNRLSSGPRPAAALGGAPASAAKSTRAPRKAISESFMVSCFLIS
jgi:hypothetical protein